MTLAARGLAARGTLARRIATPLATLAAGLLAGCGGRADVAPVSGTIRLDGQPLAGARINTQPLGEGQQANPGIGSFAVTDDTGRYSLELASPPQPGAVVGTHRVRITKKQAVYREGRADAPVYQSAPLPREASNGSLRLEVPPEGLDAADFDLTTAPGTKS